MLQSLASLLAPPVLERSTLVINHVLAAEPVAQDRLKVHAGRAVALDLDGWPALLPPAPPLAWRITPAGLLEWCGLDGAPAAELQLHLDASNPALLLARALAGERPALRIEGDAQLAADVGWLTENLRWDAAADLERFFGPVVAQQLVQVGRMLAAGLRSALGAVEPLVQRLRPGRG
jgi:ubiquinone biosynthesis protein UbiJ